jgi:hypothetical protein
MRAARGLAASKSSLRPAPVGRPFAYVGNLGYNADLNIEFIHNIEFRARYGKSV